MDNWYISIALVDYLDHNSIKTTGTVKKINWFTEKT